MESATVNTSLIETESATSKEYTISSETGSESNSPPKKRTKINKNQEPTTDTQPQNGEPRQPITKNGIYNFCLPSEGESDKTPQGNLVTDSAGSKGARAGGVWHRSLEESHSAQIRERSLPGYVQCLDDSHQILESDIFRILKCEGVQGIEAMYKVSPSKFVLVFGSRAEKGKIFNTVIHSRFGESDLYLNFSKRGGPLRNGNEPILVTINLPEHVSDQAVELAFSNFGEVVSVLKGRHKFNRKLKNGKRHVRIFPAGGDPAVLPRKISFFGGASKDVLFAEKVVQCYRCKTRHMLGENCPVAAPTPEGSSMSHSEQSETPQDSSPAGSQQESRINEERSEEFSSAGLSGGGSSSGLSPEFNEGDGSERVPSVPDVPSQRMIVSSPPRTPINPDKANKKPVKRFKTLRDIDLPCFNRQLNRTTTVKNIMKESKLSINKNSDLSRDLLRMVLELLDNRNTAEYDHILNSYTIRLKENYSFNYSPKQLEDFFCDVANYRRPELLSRIRAK